MTLKQAAACLAALDPIVGGGGEEEKEEVADVMMEDLCFCRP